MSISTAPPSARAETFEASSGGSWVVNQSRPAAVDLGQVQEVGREAAQPGQQTLDERVLIRGGEQQVAAFSRPIVEVRSAPRGAEQNDPAPWVGHTFVASGNLVSRCNERY